MSWFNHRYGQNKKINFLDERNILDADIKEDVSFLFEIDKNGNSSIDYYWSTKTKTWSGNSYTFKIIDFDPIRINKGQSETGIQAPSNFSFLVSNKNNALTPSDFTSDAEVIVRLVIKSDLDNVDESDIDGDSTPDGTYHPEAEIKVWRFHITGIEIGYQKLKIECEDWLQTYLEGDYPNTHFLSYLFPSKVESNDKCIPLIFGRPMIPVSLIYSAALDPLDNGNMETGDGWTETNAEVVHMRRSKEVDAAGVPFITPTEGDYMWRFGTDFADRGIESNNFTTITDHVYIINLDVNPRTVGNIKIEILHGDGTSGAYSVTHSALTVDGWNNIEFSYKETAGGASAKIQFLSTALGTWYIDNVKIAPQGGGAYIVGPDSPTYTYHRLKTPKDYEEAAIYDISGSTTVEQTLTGADGSDYKAAAFIVVDYDEDGTNDINIIFGRGEKYLDARISYERDDTSSKTNPGDIIDYILQDWGIASSLIDSTTLTNVKAIYDEWGLKFNVGFWFKEERKKILARLLAMCHTELIVRDKIYFKIHDKTSQWTVEKEWILKAADRGEGTFTYRLNRPQIKDSAYVAWADSVENSNTITSLDNLSQTLLTLNGASNISKDVIRCDYIWNNIHAQKIGTLILQRKFLPLATISFEAKGKSLHIEPDDVITINPADYGGTYDILIDSIKINKDLSIGIEGTRYSQALSNWEDLTFSGVTIVENKSLGTYSIITSGPVSAITSGNYTGNLLRGKLRVGTSSTKYISIDPVVSDISVISDSTEKVRMGELNGFLDYGASAFGLAIGSSAANQANLTFDPTNGIRLRNATNVLFQIANDGTAKIGGFYFSVNDIWGGNAAIGNAATTIVMGNLDGTSKIALGASADAITIAGTQSGFIADGGGNMRVGDTNSFLKWSGGALAIQLASGEALTIKQGGDIILTPSDANPALIKWSTVYNLGAADTAARGLCVWPTNINTGYFRVGYDPVNTQGQYFYSIWLAAQNEIRLYVYDDANNYADIGVFAGANAESIHLIVKEGGVLNSVVLDLDNGFYPIEGAIDLGKIGWSWKCGHFYDYITALGGIHVGGTAGPGPDNLLVDGNVTCPALPSTNPGIAGRMWSTGSYVRISTG